MKYLNIPLLILIFCSCELKKEDNSSMNDRLVVEIKDKTLMEVIENFIFETKINSDSTYLTVEIYSIGNREIIYLSYEKELYFDVFGYPSYLSSIENHLIFIYTNADNYINNDIYSSIKKYSEIFNITYSHEDDVLYHPEVWKLTRCDTDSFFVSKIPTTLRRDYIPCGYEFNSHTNKLDTMIMQNE